MKLGVSGGIENMRIKFMLPGIVSLALALLIFAFAEGYRRLYSGIFFAVLGVVLLVNAKRCGADVENK